MAAQALIQRLDLLSGARASSEPTEFASSLFDHMPSLDDVRFEELNQLLLALGAPTLSRGFYDWFVSLSGTAQDFCFDGSLRSWRSLSIRVFGDVRRGFDALRSCEADELTWLSQRTPVDLGRRSLVRESLSPVPREATPLLGYIAGGLVEKLRRRDESSLTLEQRDLVGEHDRQQERGLRNTYAYCTAAYMDLYIATSMRQPEDFYNVFDFSRELFGGSDHRVNGVSYFDPTQSAHPDRIAKGLVEAMMLSRAKATIYLVQEGDTLGKDSELASTLAQGKIVIAYVPKVSESALAPALVRDTKLAVKLARVAYTGEGAVPSVERRLESRLARASPDVWQALVADREISKLDAEDLASILAEALRNVYDKRAGVLAKTHPLGVQVNLSTGVTNGILVARSVGECRALMLDVLLDRLDFDLKAFDGSIGDGGAYLDDLEASLHLDRHLIETRSQCVHRYMIGDGVIRNAFWTWHHDVAMAKWTRSDLSI